MILPFPLRTIANQLTIRPIPRAARPITPNVPDSFFARFPADSRAGMIIRRLRAANRNQQ